MFNPEIQALMPDAARAMRIDDAMHAHLERGLLRLAGLVVDDVADIGETLTGVAGLIAGGRRVPSAAFAVPERLERILLAGDAEGARALANRLAGLPARTLRRPLLIAGTPDAAPLLSVLADEDDAALAPAPVPAAEAASFATQMAQASVLMGAHLPELRAEADILVQEILLGHRQPGAPAVVDRTPHSRFWGLLMLDPGLYRTPIPIIGMLARETAQALLCGMAIEARDQSVASGNDGFADAAFGAAVAAARVVWAMERIVQDRETSDQDRAEAMAAAEAARAELGPDALASAPAPAEPETGGGLGSVFRTAMASLAAPLSA